MHEDTTKALVATALQKSSSYRVPAKNPVKRYQYNFENAGTEFKSRPDNTIQPEILRRFAITHEVSRICINARKRQIAQLDWNITPIGAGKVAPDGFDKQIDLVKRWFKHPAGPKTRFRQLSDMIIEDLLVLDTIAIYKERDAKGRVVWLKPIDAASIKIVVDEYGDLPEPPNIAYRQYVRGQLQAEFTYDDLIFDCMNPRTTTPYGLAPIESLILVVSSALRASLFNLDYLTYQNIPEGLLEMPEGWSRTMIEEFQDAWDAMVAGQGEVNSKLRVVPTGTKYSATKKPDEMGFAAFNDWLMQITCAMFEIQPHEIGFTDKTNRATAKEQDDVTQRRGIKPLAQMLKELFDDIIQVDLGFENLEFTYVGLEDEDDLLDAQAMQIRIQTGELSIDEARIADGFAPIGIDTPYILAGTGPVWVTSGVVQNELEDSDNHFEVPADANDDEPGDPEGSDDTNNNGPSIDPSIPGGVDQPTNGTSQMSASDTIEDLRKQLVDEPLAKLDKELKAFRTATVRRMKMQKNYRNFESAIMHPVIVAELNARARKATTTAEITKIIRDAEQMIKADPTKSNNKLMVTLAGMAGYSALKSAFKDGIAKQMNTAAAKIAKLSSPPQDAQKFADGAVPKISTLVSKEQVADWNTTVFNTSVQNLYKSVGADTEFDLTSNAYQQTLLNEADTLLQKSSLDDTTKQMVATIVQNGALAGDTPAQIATSITDQVDGISDYRANMIAVTETNSMANSAQLDAMKQMGVTQKSWVTYGDNPCPICEGNEEEGPIDIDKSFDSGDDAPEAHPWCQCALDTDVSADDTDNLWDGSDTGLDDGSAQ